MVFFFQCSGEKRAACKLCTLRPRGCSERLSGKGVAIQLILIIIHVNFSISLGMKNFKFYFCIQFSCIHQILDVSLNMKKKIYLLLCDDKTFECRAMPHGTLN